MANAGVRPKAEKESNPASGLFGRKSYAPGDEVDEYDFVRRGCEEA